LPTLYFAGANRNHYLRAMSVGAYLLESFADKSCRKFVANFRHKFWALDCGAFSVYTKTQGKQIDLIEYRDYIQSWSGWEWYLSVDVIGGTEKENMQNYSTLVNYGLSPVPVFHENEDFSLLKEYVQSSSRPALGAIPPRIDKTVIPFLRKSFEVIQSEGRGTKVHGLAMVKYGYFPFESVDSRTWAPATHQLPHPFVYANLNDRIALYEKGVRAKWKTINKGKKIKENTSQLSFPF